METKDNHIETLIGRIEEYSKTSFELIKLKIIDKMTDALSKLFCHIVFVLIVCFFVLFLSLGAAMYLGEYCGKMYHGFMLVSAFYGVVGIIFWFVRAPLKTKIKNSIIFQLFN